MGHLRPATRTSRHATVAPPSDSDEPRSDHKSRAFRPDIEGLRAVAVALVVLYHAGVSFVPGGFVGVDIFFVISGFLITTQLISEWQRTGRISLTRFYARRAKRILPAAAVVLAVSALLSRLVLPRIRWEEIGGDLVAAALYAVNWRLAQRSVDYLAEDSQPSPVQHFWSLAVEEQFYLVWPLLILLAGVAATVLRLPRGWLLWTGLIVVAVPSFVWSLVATPHSPAEAFFVTTTRMWELAIGAAVAVGSDVWRRVPRVAAIALGWVGLAAIVLAGGWFTTAVPWPGSAAALPTLGTAAIIAAGFTVQRGGPGPLLGTATLQWVGALSYSLYLWHWPLLVAATAYWGQLSGTAGLTVVALAVIPAWLTYTMVENPLRYSTTISRSPRLALTLGAGFTLAGVIAGLLLLTAVPAPADRQAVAPWQKRIGAMVLADNPRDDPAGQAPASVDVITPDPLTATTDLPDLYDDGCHQNATDAEVLSCTYGNPYSPTTVAVAGDSKIAQWLPALQPLAEQNNWKLVVFTKSSCGLHSAVVADHDGRPYRSCLEWNTALLRRLTTVDKPAYVITSQSTATALQSDRTPSAEAMIDGLRASWAALTATGTQIIVIADNPHPGMNIYQCVDQHRDDLTRCTYSRDVRVSDGAYTTQLRAVQGQPKVKMIDLFDAICPTRWCSPVIGDVLVYRQSSHITATYIRTLTPRLAEALTRAGLPARFV